MVVQITRELKGSFFVDVFEQDANDLLDRRLACHQCRSPLARIAAAAQALPYYPIRAQGSKTRAGPRSRARKPMAIAKATAPSILNTARSLSSFRLPAGSVVATALARFQFKTGLFSCTI